MDRRLNAIDLVRRMIWPFTDNVAPRTMGPHDREFLATSGVSAAVIGALYAADPSARTELFLGWLWPWWWIATGIVIIAYAIWPWSTNLHALSGASLTAACVSRAIALIYAVALDNVPEDRVWRTIGGVIVWLLLGRLVRRQWRTLGPTPRRDRVART